MKANIAQLFAKCNMREKVARNRGPEGTRERVETKWKKDLWNNQMDSSSRITWITQSTNEEHTTHIQHRETANIAVTAHNSYNQIHSEKMGKC